LGVPREKNCTTSGREKVGTGKMIICDGSRPVLVNGLGKDGRLSGSGDLSKSLKDQGTFSPLGLSKGGRRMSVDLRENITLQKDNPRCLSRTCFGARGGGDRCPLDQKPFR